MFHFFAGMNHAELYIQLDFFNRNRKQNIATKIGQNLHC